MNNETIYIDLKNKITQQFSKISPDDTQKFENTMNKFDKIIGGMERFGSESQKSLRERDVDEEEEGSGSPVFSEISLDEQELEEIEKLKDTNQVFREEEIQKLQYQIVENFALPESLVTYRDDEIISELIEYLREEYTAKPDLTTKERKSTTFANDEKLELWVNNLMSLVKKTSIIETDKIDETKQYIKGAKDIPDNYKPILNNFNSGVGTGVDWITPVAKEKKKIYGAGEMETDYIYSVEEAEETGEIYKIIESKSNQGPEKDRFVNYDIQQKKLSTLDKVSKITDDIVEEIATRKVGCLIEAEEEHKKALLDLEIESADDETMIRKRREVDNAFDAKQEFCNTFYEPKVLSKNNEVFYFENADNILGKRVLDKGLTRPENVYKTKETEKISEKKIKTKSIGSKKLVGQKEITVVEPEKVLVDGFVLSPPGFKDKQHYGSYYTVYNKNVPENYKKDIKDFSEVSPFRDLHEEYVVFKYNIPSKDYFSLKKETNPLLTGGRQISLSNIKPSDKIVLKFLYPTLNDSATIDLNEQLLPLPVRISEINLDSYKIPNNIYVLAQVSDIEDNLDEVSNKINRKLFITPMVINSKYITEQWLESSVLVKTPKIIKRLDCNCDNLKVNNTAVIYLTELLKQKYIDGKKVNTISGKNKYFVGKIDKREQEIVDKHYIFKIKITFKDEKNIEFSIIENLSNSSDTRLLDKIIKLDISNFKDIYLSKNLEDADYVDYCMDSLNTEQTDVSINLVEDIDESNSVDVWGKVINIIDRPKVISDDKRINKTINEMTYLVQSISPCSKSVGSYFLIKQSDMLYSIQKRIFERYLLGDTSLVKWFQGIFINEDIDYFVPTINEFLNKITKILRKKDSLGYNFINVLLNLALQYEKYQINTSIKQRLNDWIEWNIVKHIENRALDIEDIRENYIEMMNNFIEGDELNPNKFKLVKDIPNEYQTYKDWKVKMDTIDWSKIKNRDVVETLVKEHKKNKELWASLNREELSHLQKQNLREELASVTTWSKVYNPLEKIRSSALGLEKTREQKIVESILSIADPAIKSDILLNFVDNNCYLAQDIKTNQYWYYSKIDTKKTKLLCPHVYDDFKGKSLEKYLMKIDDGSTICNNCAQVLNSLTFSYFEGYGDEAVSRGNVIEVDGVERAGTMEDLTIQVSIDELGEKEQPAINIVETVFNAESNPAEFIIEELLNSILKHLPRIRVFLGNTEEALEIKKEAIIDIRKYMLESDINDFDSWKVKSAKSLEKVIKLAIDRDRKAKEAKFVPKAGKKFEYTRDMAIKATEQTLSSLYKYELELVKYQSIIARLAILIEKQVPKDLMAEYLPTITYIVRQMAPELKITKESEYIEKTKIIYLVFRERFPNIALLYQVPTQQIKEFGLIEEKFSEYTERNIDSSLTLYDGIEWLKYHLKRVHKGETIAISEPQEVECGLIKPETYTSDEKLQLTRTLENAIHLRDVERHQKWTGVKSRKQIYSTREFVLPEVSGTTVEANFISKNLYVNPTPTQVKEVESNLSRFKQIDYLITYKAINNTILPRLYENNVDDETGKTREELIEYYKALSDSELNREYESIKSKSIKCEDKKEIQEIETFDLDLSKYNAVFDKLVNSMKTILTDTDIRSFASQLKYVTREYTIKPSTNDIILDIDNIKETDPKKVQKIKIDILNREYEKLNTIMTILKRDYNYIANNYDIKERIDKMRLTLEIGEDESYINEYEYLTAFTNFENAENRSGLNKITNELTLIESVSLEGSKDTLGLLEKRNKINTMIIYIVLLKLLTQVKYVELFNLDNSEFLKELSNINFDMDDSTNVQNRFIGRFVYETINNIIAYFLRQKEILSGIKSYKQDMFELHKQSIAKKSAKEISLIGKDLAFEFNKVMKGKRKLGVEVTDLASDEALESAKLPRLDRYSAEALDQYTTIDKNVIEGEQEEGDNEEARMDQMD